MRVDYTKVLPDARAALLGLERAVHESSLDPITAELIKLRASQINGCAHCVEMHAKDARALGELQERLDLVAVWREATCFTPAERAALQWCEDLTNLPDHGAPQHDYEAVACHFPPDQLVALTLAIGAINVWNRLNVAFEVPTAGYVSHLQPRLAPSESS